MSWESVRIDLTYAALNGLDVYGCDIKNYYLKNPSYEKHFIICGPEFCLENVGNKSLIIRALYEGIFLVRITGDMSNLQWVKWAFNPANLTLTSGIVLP